MDCNNNNNYRLYKLVFNNKVISIQIYRHVRKVNKQIIYSKNNLKSFNTIIGYHEASFEWILRNKQYNLLLDKIKCGFKFTGFTYELLKNFFGYLNNSIKDKTELSSILNKFYKVNYEELINLELIQSYSSLEIKKISMVVFSIHISSLEFLKIVLKNSIHGIIENDLLDIAIICGNLEIIKFIHKELEMNLKYPTKALFNSLLSENRNQVIEYLLDEVKYQPPTKYTGSYDYYFHSLLKLDFKLFKRLYDLQSPMFYRLNDLKSLTSIYTYPSSSTSSSSSSTITNNQLIEFIKCSIFSSIIESTSPINKKRLKSTFKKIKYLIKYNERNSTEPEDIDSDCEAIGNPLVNDTNSESKKKSNSSILSNFKSIVSKPTPTTTTTPTTTSTTPTPPTTSTTTLTNEKKFNFNIKNGIKFDEFDLVREIKRVYIYDYLNYEDTIIQFEKFIPIVISFAREYKEYHLIDDLISTATFNLKNVAILEVIQSSLQYADSNLLSSIYKKSVIENPVSSVKATTGESSKPSRIFNPNEINVDQQIEYFKTVLKFNVNAPCSITNLLEHIISGKQILSNLEEYLTKLGDVIRNDYDKQSQIYSNTIFGSKLKREPSSYRDSGISVYSASVLISNELIFYYCWENLNNLFKWDTLDIGRKVVETGNIDFINFLHYKKIGSLDNSNAIDYSKTIEVAKHMTDLGYIFSSKALSIVSSLDDYKSGYLFYYTFKMVCQLYNVEKTSSPIELPYHLGNNYKRSRLILTALLDGSLNLSSICNTNDSRRIITTVLTLDNWISYFNFHLKLDTVISTCNYSNVKSFFQDYESGSLIEKKRFNITVNQNSLKLVSEIINPKIKQYIENKLSSLQIDKKKL